MLLNVRITAYVTDELTFFAFQQNADLFIDSHEKTVIIINLFFSTRQTSEKQKLHYK
jgi:hypothetical protein